MYKFRVSFQLDDGTMHEKVVRGPDAEAAKEAVFALCRCSSLTDKKLFLARAYVTKLKS